MSLAVKPLKIYVSYYNTFEINIYKKRWLSSQQPPHMCEEFEDTK
jgi:hypothetical protein